ncbi:hypothetical protein [Pelagibacterium halotolerans]|uniref:hypothetical protein n=1 Tax=Pelagibacterium halotolerans TaxID=531813 RepID=UPI00384BCBC0
MMLSQPKTMGVFVLATAVAFAGGWMQRDAFGLLTAGPAIQDKEGTERQGIPEVPDAERTASAPARVVDGPEPIVTVNGRPLDSGSNLAATETAAVEPKPASTVAPAREAEPAAVAAIEPPKPMPRPEGLSLPASQAIDYGTVTASTGSAAARPGPEAGFMSYEERIALAPLTGESQPMPGRRGRDELVAVVGANGEVIWVYEEQTRGATTFPVRPVVKSGNPYGFVYDDYDFRW